VSSSSASSESPYVESSDSSFDAHDLLAQVLPNAPLSAATALAVLPHRFTGKSSGACALFPDATPGESEVTPAAFESASAALQDRDRMPVAAAAANTPLLRVCRNVVIFLLEELGKPASERRSTSKAGLCRSPGSARL
jgi:hypothetical protein